MPFSQSLPKKKNGLGRIRTYDQSVVSSKPGVKQLSPSSQDVIITLIKHLVEKEGITVPSSPAMGLQVPMDGFDLWVAKLNQESYSPRTTNPINGVKSIKARKQERGLPTEEQIKKLLTYRYYRKEQGQRFQLLVVLLITTGLRITEAVSILKQDIKLDRHEIRVIGKGSKERVVPILPVADALMRDYLPADNSPYLFPARNAKGYRDISSIEKVFRRVYRRDD